MFYYLLRHLFSPSVQDGDLKPLTVFSVFLTTSLTPLSFHRSANMNHFQTISKPLKCSLQVDSKFVEILTTVFLNVEILTTGEPTGYSSYVFFSSDSLLYHPCEWRMSLISRLDIVSLLKLLLYNKLVTMPVLMVWLSAAPKDFLYTLVFYR